MPEIRILQEADEVALEAFLLPRVESSKFLIGNMRLAGLVDTGQRYGGTYAAAFEGPEIIAAAALFWNGNLITQAPVHLEAVWRATLQAAGRPLCGLLGPDDQISVVKATLALDDAATTSGAIQLDQTDKLYKLPLHELVVPDHLRSGRFQGRRMERRDLDLLAEWRAGFEVEALGEENSPELRRVLRDDMERLLDEGQTWILEDQGTPVSTSAFNTAIAEAVQIGGVWTPPELRGRGYGRAVVAASLLDARARGAGTAILFTGEDNVPAQKAYEALGFRHIGDYRLILLRTPLEATA